MNKIYLKYRPSTPVFDLLEHKYQDKWIQEKRKSELCRRYKENERNKSANSSKGYCETRASRMRRYSPPVDPTPLWQMSKFQKVNEVEYYLRVEIYSHIKGT